MADTTNLKYSKPTVGGSLGTWGGVLNAIADAVDTTIAGVLNVDITTHAAGVITLPTISSDATSRSPLIRVYGVQDANVTLYVPNCTRIFAVTNVTTGGTYTLTIRATGDSGGGVLVNRTADSASATVFLLAYINGYVRALKSSQSIAADTATSAATVTDANVAKYNAATANFTGDLQKSGNSVLTTSAIGSSVQAFDADTAKYDATTANFTGTLQKGGVTVATTADLAAKQGILTDVHGIELTGGLSGDRPSLIDFHADDTNTDYSTRIARYAGVNGRLVINQAGTGDISIIGGTTLRRDIYTIWHGGNDGPGSGLDADKLDGEEGTYYRNATNMNAGTLPTARLPSTVPIQVVSQVEAEAGTSTENRTWTPQRVSQAITALAPSPAVAFSSFARLVDQKGTGVSSGSFVPGAWRVRDLNTEIADPDNIVTVAANQFTLGAGTYLIRWAALAEVNSQDHFSRLWNATTSTVASAYSYGTTIQHNSGDGTTASEGSCWITLAGANIFQVEHYLTGAGTESFGESNSVQPSVFCSVDIWKV